MGLEALSSNGKFLGRWAPATKCNCWCGRKITLAGGLWWLAVVQILTSSCSLIIKIFSCVQDEPPEHLSEPAVEIALAFWMLNAIKNVEDGPILDFAFVQFILAIKGTIDCIATTLFLFITAGSGDDDGAIKAAAGVFSMIYAWCTVPYKVYYAYVAWSFVATHFPDDLEALSKDASWRPRIESIVSLTRAENFVFGTDLKSEIALVQPKTVSQVTETAGARLLDKEAILNQSLL
jgi:hypothetical protein